jgi:hypothetical protein
VEFTALWIFTYVPIIAHRHWGENEKVREEEKILFSSDDIGDGAGARHYLEKLHIIVVAGSKEEPIRSALLLSAPRLLTSGCRTTSTGRVR